MKIEIDGFSSDGDSRLLAAMRSQVDLNDEYMLGNTALHASYIQDTIHLVLKIRNRLLKPSILIPMGNKQVSVSHLKILISNTSKDVHGLVLQDVCPDDKQNYRSLQKIIQPRVLDALISNVPECQGTVLYLKLCSYIDSAMNDMNMKPTERIKRIWFSVFFFRIWRKWILTGTKTSTAKYSLKENWITLNAYACAEVNAHNIVHIMRKFRDDGDDNLFLPFMFNSQTCEQAFRQFRSMTTMNWTKINFSVLELTHMISRLELQNEIVHFKLANTGIEFPRIAKTTEKFEIYAFPLDHEIKNVIKTAKNDALLEAHKFGINIHSNQITRCELRNVSCEYDEIDLDDTQSDTDDFEAGDVFVDPFAFDNDEEEMLSGILRQNLCLKDYTEYDPDIDENSRFTKVTDKNGDSKIVRKSSVVWLLSNSNKENLSRDRLQRVQGASRKKKHRLHLPSKFPPFATERMVFISDELLLGQWAFFANPIQLKRSKNSNGIENYIVGSVMGFIYSNGKTDKERQYSWDHASIKNKNINVSASWYRLKSNGEFQTLKHCNVFYVPIQNYVMSMQSPHFESNNVSGSCRIYLSIVMLRFGIISKKFLNYNEANIRIN